MGDIKSSAVTETTASKRNIDSKNALSNGSSLTKFLSQRMVQFQSGANNSIKGHMDSISPYCKARTALEMEATASNTRLRKYQAALHKKGLEEPPFNHKTSVNHVSVVSVHLSLYRCSNIFHNATQATVPYLFPQWPTK